MPASFSPAPAPLHTILHVPSVLLCVSIYNVHTPSSSIDTLQRAVLLGTQRGAVVSTPSFGQLPIFIINACYSHTPKYICIVGKKGKHSLTAG